MKVKVCSRCGVKKPLTFFTTKKRNKDGLEYWCHDCCNSLLRDWHKRNPEKYSFYSKLSRQRNPEKTQQRELLYSRNNKEKIYARLCAWRRLNMGKVLATIHKRNAVKLQAVPLWADLEKIKQIFIEASRLGLTVDHVIPLQGKLVCGLHVHNNLQLLTKSENSKKGNRYQP